MIRPFVCLLAATIAIGCASRRAPITATAEGILARTGRAVPTGESAPSSPLPPDISLSRPLSADDAVAVALWNNAQLRADLATIGLAEADVIDAGLLRNPRLDLLVPIGVKPFESLLSLPVEILWQRPRRIAASQAALDQIAQSLIQNGLNAARDARWAHADAVQALERVSVAREAAALRERIATLATARLQAGDISELETISARTEAGSARELLSRAQHDQQIALERLRFVLGLATERAAISVSPSPADAAEPPPVDALLEKAQALRPDLRAAELAVVAATKRAKWERSRVGLLTAQLSAKEVGANGVLAGPGVSAELPIFHRNQGLIARADVEVEVASRQYLALKQRVALEVAESRAQLAQARDSLRQIEADILPPLERALARADDQYKNGEVAYLFVLEQTRGLVDARLRLIDTEAAIRHADAQLQRSVGSR
jgi:outer membrane protein, heavy metal efflux system